MKKGFESMRLGVALHEADPWSFFNEIYAGFRQHYDTVVFSHRPIPLPFLNTRVNHYLFRHDLQTFMRVNDVVFFEWASGLLAAATQLPKTCGIVTRLHRYELDEWADQVNWHVVDRVILVSQAMQREFVARFPEQAPKTLVSSPSTSLSKFMPSTKDFSGDLGILCHLTPRKRVYDLILTFYELTQKKSDLRLHIAGGRHPAHKDYFNALHRLVKDLDLAHKVTFYDHVTETWNWYHHIDIFISNSYSEGLQVAPMEAMASGCYCLCHRWSGAEELLPQENLFFTGSELQQKVLSYCELPELQKQQQRRLMRALAGKKFDINQTIAQIRQVVEEVAVLRLSSGTSL